RNCSVLQPGAPYASAPTGENITSRSVRPVSASSSCASSRRAASCSTVASSGVLRRAALSAGLGNGIQPSPSSTARRSARRELPPIQIGGGGGGTGPGGVRGGRPPPAPGPGPPAPPPV